MPKARKYLLPAGILASLAVILMAYGSVRARLKFDRVKSLQVLSAPGISRLQVKILSSYAHDRRAFTEGLAWHGNFLYESTGIRGKSAMRNVHLPTGKAIKTFRIPKHLFAEGITLFQGKIYQLTWKSHKCLVYDMATLRKTGELPYTGEGWGLTHDGETLIMSDGTSRLRFVDPATFKTARVLSVSLNGAPLGGLNELEYVNGMIYANIYFTNTIVRIDVASGRVTGLVDLRPLYKKMSPGAFHGIGVPNGIAYDPVKRHFYLTGKFWPRLFEVVFAPQNK